MNGFLGFREDTPYFAACYRAQLFGFGKTERKDTLIFCAGYTHRLQAEKYRILDSFFRWGKWQLFVVFSVFHNTSRNDNSKVELVFGFRIA
jgi:hypothetical protein